MQAPLTLMPEEEPLGLARKVRCSRYRNVIHCGRRPVGLNKGLEIACVLPA